MRTAVLVDDDLGVVARDAEVLQHHLAVGGAADHDLAGREGVVLGGVAVLVESGGTWYAMAR